MLAWICLKGKKHKHALLTPSSLSAAHRSLIAGNYMPKSSHLFSKTACVACKLIPFQPTKPRIALAFSCSNQSNLPVSESSCLVRAVLLNLSAAPLLVLSPCLLELNAARFSFMQPSAHEARKDIRKRGAALSAAKTRTGRRNSAAVSAGKEQESLFKQGTQNNHKPDALAAASRHASRAHCPYASTAAAQASGSSACSA